MTYSMPVTQKLRKLVKSLYQKQHRENNGLFVAEGEKLVYELKEAGFVIELVVARELPSPTAKSLIEQFSEEAIPIYSAPKHVFDQMCDAKSPQTILAVANVRESKLLKGESFIALDAVSDPGNVGTIIRTADWFGYKQVLLGKECADAMNPKVLRAAMGSSFKIHVVETDDLAETIKENFSNLDIYGADVNADDTIDKYRPEEKYGIVMGSEAHGISDEVAKLVNKTFLIDGSGNAESLNVAVAAGITMYKFSGAG